MTQELIAAVKRNGIGYAAVIDPCNAFDAPAELLIEASGILLPWACDAVQTDDPIKFMQDAYGFGGLHPMTGGTVAEDGTYSYPEDPDLKPIAAVYTNGEPSIFIYEYAIVHFVAEKFTTRMD